MKNGLTMSLLFFLKMPKIWVGLTMLMEKKRGWPKRFDGGMLPRAGCLLISPGEKELTTRSNHSGKQRYRVISKVQLSKKSQLDQPSFSRATNCPPITKG